MKREGRVPFWKGWRRLKHGRERERRDENETRDRRVTEEEEEEGGRNMKEEECRKVGARLTTKASIAGLLASRRRLPMNQSHNGHVRGIALKRNSHRRLRAGDL
ncbi:hypothetical protein BHE74_00034235 [Ensete ventricosum]|nr:hypothetical protein BHE74_00034235 [Ensete ventricosum]